MKLTAVLAALLAAGIAWLGPRGLAAAKLRWEIWQLERNPDERYRLAERYYQAGDFEKARACCIAVLQREPSHAPARALRMEVEFILGVWKGDAWPGCERYWGNPQVLRHQQTLVEIDTAFVRADRALADGDSAAAEKELRKILEYAKWMPTGVEVATREKQARRGLDSLEVRRCDR